MHVRVCLSAFNLSLLSDILRLLNDSVKGQRLYFKIFMSFKLKICLQLFFLLLFIVGFRVRQKISRISRNVSVCIFEHTHTRGLLYIHPGFAV